MKSMILILIIIAQIFTTMTSINSAVYKERKNDQLLFNEEEEERIKILTPLGNQSNDKTYPVKTSDWDAAKVESCRQAWLLKGGVFLRDNNEQELKFLEKNNFLVELNAKCILIDGNSIFLGTEDGIYLSTDNAASWLTWENDVIDNLDNHIIYDLVKLDNTLFACTSNGLLSSTNGGVTWDPKLNYSTKRVKFDGPNIIYAGTEAGLSKSTDGGSSWSFKLNQPVNSLYLSSSLLYLGGGVDPIKGLWKSTNGGDNWEQKYYLDVVTEIFIDGSNIYIGTEKSGILRSTNGGDQFSNYRAGLPKTNSSDYFRINSIQKYNSMLFAGIDNELYFYDEEYTQWSRIDVRDHQWGRDDMNEKLIKKIYPENNNLWIICSKSSNPKYPTATMVTDYEYPMNPNNLNAFNCHTFAWHFTEGGETGIELDAPKSQKYIPQDNATEWERNNWDYIEADSWEDPDWEKVKYQGDHSGIKSPNMTTFPDNENDLLIISKWTVNGPLVEHKLRDCILSGGNLKYYKSKKVVDGEIIDDRRIGRQLITKSGSNIITTYIPDKSTVNFYVAPMYNNKIHLKSGFHSKFGSNFHAFVKGYYLQDNNKKICKIPWEEEPTLLYSKKDSAVEVEKNGIFHVANSSDFVNVMNNLNDKSIKKTNLRQFSSTRIDTQPCHKYWGPFTFSGKGSGTKDDPYQITELEHFKEYFSDLDGDHYWILMNDIEGAATRYWNGTKIGDDSVYIGFGLGGTRQRQLDGQGFKIKNTFTSNGSFLGGLNCFTLKRVGFENLHLVDLSLGDFRLIDQSRDDIDFVMEECFFSGSLYVPYFQKDPIGIIPFGVFHNNIKIMNCYLDLNIIADSLILPSVYIPNNPENRDVLVKNFYLKVTTTAKNKIYSPFSYLGETTGQIISCFWDNELLKITEPLGRGIGLPTSEMMKRETFEKAGWDFENVWYIDEGMDYPKLRVFKKELSTEKENKIIDFILNVSQSTEANNYKVQYGMPYPSSVEIALYNSLGSPVRILLNNNYHQEGTHTLNFDGSALSSGVYFIVMRANQEILTQKIIIIN